MVFFFSVGRRGVVERTLEFSACVLTKGLGRSDRILTSFSANNFFSSAGLGGGTFPSAVHRLLLTFEGNLCNQPALGSTHQRIYMNEQGEEPRTSLHVGWTEKQIKYLSCRVVLRKICKSASTLSPFCLIQDTSCREGSPTITLRTIIFMYVDCTIILSTIILYVDCTKHYLVERYITVLVEFR